MGFFFFLGQQQTPGRERNRGWLTMETLRQTADGSHQGGRQVLTQNLGVVGTGGDQWCFFEPSPPGTQHGFAHLSHQPVTAMGRPVAGANRPFGGRHFEAAT